MFVRPHLPTDLGIRRTAQAGQERQPPCPGRWRKAMVQREHFSAVSGDMGFRKSLRRESPSLELKTTTDAEVVGGA